MSSPVLAADKSGVNVVSLTGPVVREVLGESGVSKLSVLLLHKWGTTDGAKEGSLVEVSCSLSYSHTTQDYP
jgi:hypothetical protein